jgi:hypothetical protein
MVVLAMVVLAMVPLEEAAFVARYQQVGWMDGARRRRRRRRRRAGGAVVLVLLPVAA